MCKNFNFYRCHLEREKAGKGEPGLLAATEVVQAVCDAGFQKNAITMRNYPSSPHCYYKYAKPPKEGMYMLRAVKKTDMTSLDILIDTRLYPSFVMIEKHKDWQEETEEVKDTLEQVINGGAEKFNWHVNLQEHHTNTTQHLQEFISALSYMKDQEDLYEKHNAKERNEELFHFVHPEIEDREAWLIHDAVKRLVKLQGIQMICLYLWQLKNEQKVLLPPNPMAAYTELVRLGMPQGGGYNETTFRKYYNKR